MVVDELFVVTLQGVEFSGGVAYSLWEDLEGVTHRVPCKNRPQYQRLFNVIFPNKKSKINQIRIFNDSDLKEHILVLHYFLENMVGTGFTANLTTKKSKENHVKFTGLFNINETFTIAERPVVSFRESIKMLFDSNFDVTYFTDDEGNVGMISYEN